MSGLSRKYVRRWVAAAVLGGGVGVAAAQSPQGTVPVPALPSEPQVPQTPVPSLPPIPIDPPDAPVLPPSPVSREKAKPATQPETAPAPREASKPTLPTLPTVPAIPPAEKVEIPTPPSVPSLPTIPVEPPRGSAELPKPSVPAPSVPSLPAKPASGSPELPVTSPGGVTGKIEAVPATPAAVKPVTAPPAAPAVTLTPEAARVADPLGVMLAEGKATLAKVRDYTCTFTRQERVNGVLGAEQVAEMKVRSQPYSVYVRFARPEGIAGTELCYVAGKQIGKMRVHPKTADRFVSVSLDDPKLLAEHRHPANELGVGALLELLTGIATRERMLNNPVEVFTSDFQFAGKNVTRYEVFTRRPHAHRYAYRMLVYVDKETKLPVRFEAYDAPKPGQTAGDLLEAYSYTDLKPNVGLGDSAFDY